MNVVFVFNGENARLPSGVFADYITAEKWISHYLLSGILTAYPVNVGVYDWAIDNNHFQVKHEQQATPNFIQKFSSAAMEHYHFENGTRVA